MKLKNALVLTITIATSFACEQKVANNSSQNPSSKTPAANVTAKQQTKSTAITPAPTPKDGDYKGKGVVTKINMELGSVEMDHEEIKDLMPEMTMEFFVSDKKMLDGLKVGDKVDFVIRYKDRNETIIKITKTQ